VGWPRLAHACFEQALLGSMLGCAGALEPLELCGELTDRRRVCRQRARDRLAPAIEHRLCVVHTINRSSACSRRDELDQRARRTARRGVLLDHRRALATRDRAASLRVVAAERRASTRCDERDLSSCVAACAAALR
jgi:hypothetical protein